MMNVKFTITLGEAKFETTTVFDQQVPVYVISDEAYRLAMIFAETQYIAKYGRPIEMHQFADMLTELDYSYSINGVEFDD